MTERSTSTIDCTKGNCRSTPVLSGSEICSIIRACAKAKVSEISLGEVRVVFGVAQGGPSPWLGLPAPQGLHPDPITHNIDGQEPPGTMEMSDSDKAAMDEMIESHMLIESPLAYEDSIIDSAMRADNLRDSEIDE